LLNQLTSFKTKLGFRGPSVGGPAPGLRLPRSLDIFKASDLNAGSLSVNAAVKIKYF
jgi:hypothetical protein